MLGLGDTALIPSIREQTWMILLVAYVCVPGRNLTSLSLAPRSVTQFMTSPDCPSFTVGEWLFRISTIAFTQKEDSV